MKIFDRRTSKSVDSFLKDFRDEFNELLENPAEEEGLLTAEEAQEAENILLAIELAIPDSMGNKKFISRH